MRSARALARTSGQQESLFVPDVEESLPITSIDNVLTAGVTVPGVSNANVLSHPVRLRVVLALLGDRQLTTTQLAEELQDVPIASLYRHLGSLYHAGVLEVVSERKVRAVTERTYGLVLANAQIDRESAAAMTRAEKERAFGVFAAGLIAVFNAHLDRVDQETEEPTDAWDVDEAVSFRTAPVYVDANDLEDLRHAIRAAVEPFMESAEGKHRLLLSTVVLPA